MHGPELGSGVDVTELGFEVQPFQRVHVRLRCPMSIIAATAFIRRDVTRFR